MTDFLVSRLTAKAVVKVAPELQVTRLTVKVAVKTVPEFQVSRLVAKVLMAVPTSELVSPRVQIVINA